MVWPLHDSILFTEKHCFTSHNGQVESQPHPCQHQQLKPYIFLDLTLKGLEAQIQGGRDGTPNENISRMPLQELEVITKST